MSDDGPGTREVAHRVFAAEFDDASLSYSESDEERAPNYVVTPTGARVNRLFIAGVLTEVERVNDETNRGRLVDPSGAFVTYAGQYQPDEQAFLSRVTTPSFVALTGKARTFEPDDADRVFTSVRPESLNEVDADTRDRWVVSAAEATLDRLAIFERALETELRGERLRDALETAGVSASLAAGIPKAIEHYQTAPAYVEAIRRLAVDSLELIAGDRSEVRTPSVEPDAGDDVEIGPLPETDVMLDSDDAATHTQPAETASTAERTGVSSPADSTVTGDDIAGDSEDAEDELRADTAVDSEDTEDELRADTAVDSETADSPSDFDTFDDDPAASTEDAPGDFDTFDDDSGASTEDALGDFEDEATAGDDQSASNDLYQIDDDEREEIEAEFGTDFSTGSEVDEPGAADIETPGPIDEDTASAGVADGSVDMDGSTGPDTSTDSDTPTDSGVSTDPDAPTPPADTTESASPTDADGDDSPADEPTEDIDLEAAVVETMSSLDEGDGADRAAVIDRVASEHGVTDDAVDDAIQDALMSGKCYEPGEGVLKAI